MVTQDSRGFEVNEFEPQLRSKVPFCSNTLWKVVNLLIPLGMRLNRITIFFRMISLKGQYTIKQ